MNLNKVKTIGKEENWVVVEHRGTKIEPGSLQLITKLLTVGASPVVAVLLTTEEEKSSLLNELRSYGADRILVITQSYFNDDCSQELAADSIYALTELLTCPNSILFSATIWGRSVAPRLQGKLDTGLTADCIDLHLADGNILVGTKPSYGDQIMCEITCPNARPQMFTVRPNVFSAKKVAPTPETAVKEQKLGTGTDEKDSLKKTIRATTSAVKVQDNQLAQASIILALGRGAASAEIVESARKLAQKIGASLGVTRPLAGNNGFSYDQQIGQSGVSVAPDLIINLGISGSAQYVSGMDKSKTIVSVNIDPNAPILSFSDYYYVGKAETFLSALSTQLGI